MEGFPIYIYMYHIYNLCLWIITCAKKKDTKEGKVKSCISIYRISTCLS